MSADILYKAAVIQMCAGRKVGNNLAQVSRLVAASVRKGARLVVLPEMFAAIGGALKQFGVRAEAERHFLSDLAAEHGIWLVGGTLPCFSREPDEVPDKKAWSSCFVYDPSGQEVTRYDKIHLFDADVNDNTGKYRESDEYHPGLSPVVFDSPLGKIGLAICFDLRFPELFRELRQQGADIICVPSAFAKVTGQAHWEVLLRARAIENQCWILAANQGGQHEGGRETWGHSMIISPWGDANILPDSAPGMVVQTINLTQVSEIRGKMSCLPQMLSCDPTPTSLP